MRFRKIISLSVMMLLAVPGLQASSSLPGPIFAFHSQGQASWYSRQSPGIQKNTSNGEVFDDAALTCALWGVRFDQRVRVTNLRNGKSVVCRVNDRGPHYRYRKEGRIIDLTRAAFEQIADPKQGLIEVNIELL